VGKAKARVEAARDTLYIAPLMPHTKMSLLEAEAPRSRSRPKSAFSSPCRSRRKLAVRLFAM
jgi:hypothetical protein